MQGNRILEVHFVEIEKMWKKCIFAMLNFLEKCRNDAVQEDPIIYR